MTGACGGRELVPALTTSYRRATFLDLRTDSRVTVDADLVCRDMAGLDPALPANRWNRPLRRYFGWLPEHRAA